MSCGFSPMLADCRFVCRAAVNPTSRRMIHTALQQSSALSPYCPKRRIHLTTGVYEIQTLPSDAHCQFKVAALRDQRDFDRKYRRDASKGAMTHASPSAVAGSRSGSRRPARLNLLQKYRQPHGPGNARQLWPSPVHPLACRKPGQARGHS